MSHALSARGFRVTVAIVGSVPTTPIGLELTKLGERILRQLRITKNLGQSRRQFTRTSRPHRLHVLDQVRPVHRLGTFVFGLASDHPVVFASISA